MDDKHDATLERIDAIHREKPRNTHPLWRGLLDGTFNQKQVQEHIRQFSIIPLYNHGYHGRLYVICPDPGWRSMLAEVVYEEGSGRLFSDGVPHHELYMRFGEALGISREAMYGTEFCSESIAFRTYFEHICGKSFLEGVSAHMLGAEAQVPGNSGRVGHSLMKQFGLSAEDIKFFTVHEEADSEHSDIGRRLLREFTADDEDLDLVVKTVQEMVNMSQLFYDGIYRHIQKFS